MQKKGYKGRCEKRKLEKSQDICRFYSDIQSVYGDLLQGTSDVLEIICNAPMTDAELGEYTSDFLCKLTNNKYMVRECVQRKFLTKPMTVKLLEASRIYWNKHGIDNWGIVIEKEGAENV